ncbi:unnamed protein product, partial [Amoebophrya sp. A25]
DQNEAIELSAVEAGGEASGVENDHEENEVEAKDEDQEGGIVATYASNPFNKKKDDDDNATVLVAEDAPVETLAGDGGEAEDTETAKGGGEDAAVAKEEGVEKPVERP